MRILVGLLILGTLLGAASYLKLKKTKKGPAGGSVEGAAPLRQ